VFIRLGKELQKGFCEHLSPTSGRAQIPTTAALLVLTKYWGIFSYPADIGIGYSFKTFIPFFDAILGLQLNFCWIYEEYTYKFLEIDIKLVQGWYYLRYKAGIASDHTRLTATCVNIRVVLVYGMQPGYIILV
jgi:hypothetical protein